MKKRFTPYIIVAVAAFTLGFALPFFTSSEVFNPEKESVKSEVPSLTAPPSIPNQVSFAGENITLDRYDLRERMDRELMSFTYMHSTTMLTIKKANRYLPIIEPILRQQGVPDDLKYLAIIESSLNTLAKSPAGAAGMWQFMQTTGRQYGLEVNNNIDERYHIEKATVAACKYLKEAYEKYGNWLSVAASYNGGQARITSELKKQQAEKATDLWLVEETSRYMFRLLAAKEVFTNPQRFGFLLKREELYPVMKYDEVTVTTGIDTLATFAKQHGISYRELKDANPWLRQDFLQNKSGRTYVLKIPAKESIYYQPKQTKVHFRPWVVD